MEDWRMQRLTEPDLQRAEAAAKRDLPVAVVCYGGRGERGRVLEIGGRDGHCRDQGEAGFEVEAAGLVLVSTIATTQSSNHSSSHNIPGIKIHQQPLMHIKVKAVKLPNRPRPRQLPILRTNKRRSRIRGIDMQPQIGKLLL